MKNSIFAYLLAIVFTSFVVACGGGASESTTASTAEPAEAAAPSVIEILLTGSDQMKYNKEEIEVTEGQTVKLTFKHAGQLPEQAMGHNFVLLAQGTDVDAFAQAAIEHQDTEYIPPSMTSNIIAHTEMLGGGESTEIEFEAPAPGTYTYICSFPGHYGVMRGKFIVKSKVG